VSSSPAGINCGATCTASYTSGTSLTLTATPASGSTFSGWSGSGCSGTGPCTVTLSANTAVTATLTLQSTPPTNGSLKVQIGVFRPSTALWLLDNGNGKFDDCTIDSCPSSFGVAGDQPLVGDWVGTGIVQLGVYDPRTGLWELDRNANDLWEDCAIDLCGGPFGISRDLPVSGYWKSGASTASFGTYRPGWGIWYLDSNGNRKWDGCKKDTCLGPFGGAGWLPVVGDWDGTGITKIGIFNPATGLWQLNLNGNGTFDGCQVDACLGPFGQSGDLPVVGRW
jgi:hypothetical protein